MSLNTGNAILSNAITVDSNYNLGIGTSNLSSESNLFLGAKSTLEGGQLTLQKGTTQTLAAHLDNYSDRFRIMKGTDTGSTAELMCVNLSSGNVGIGTVPSSSWYSGNNSVALELSGAGNGLWCYGSTTNITTYLLNNTYYTNASGFLYGQSGGGASYYRQNNGEHIWGNAGSGTAGSAVTFSERMRITSGGNVGIGGTPISSTGQLQVFGNDGIRIINSGAEYRQLYHYAGGTLYFWNGSNQAYLTSGGVWTNASDISIKKDIKDIEYGLSDVLKLKSRWYRMKEDDIEQIGFIAQEVEEVIKEVVMTDHKGMKGLSYGNLTAVLVKAIQEQQELINNLSAKVTALENTITQQQEQINQLINK